MADLGGFKIQTILSSCTRRQFLITRFTRFGRVFCLILMGALTGWAGMDRMQIRKEVS